MINKRNKKKTFLWLMFAVFGIFNVLRYFEIYIENNQIVLSDSDCVLVVVIGLALLFTFLSVIYLIIKVNSLSCNIDKALLLIYNKSNDFDSIVEEIEDLEDNLVNGYREIAIILSGNNNRHGDDWPNEKE